MTFTRTNDRELDIDDQLRLSFAFGCRAFDREFFTTDQEYRLQVNPSFETRSDLLQQTIVNRVGERIPIPDDCIDRSYLRQRTAALE
jgi:putative restriction endonuclease